MRTVRVYRWLESHFSEFTPELLDPERLYQEKIIDDSGREIDVINYNDDRVFDFREAYLFDEKGNLVRSEMFYSEKGEADETTVFTLNEQGLVEKEEQFFIDELYSVKRNSYDTSGNLVESVLAEDGNEILKETLRWASKDCCSLEKKWENGTLVKQVEYKWRVSGPEPVLLEEIIHPVNNGDAARRIVYSVPAEENGWVSATVSRDEDIIEVTRETMEKGGALRITRRYDQNASLISEEVCETDAKGREIFRQHNENKSGFYTRTHYNENGDVSLQVTASGNDFTTCAYEYL